MASKSVEERWTEISNRFREVYSVKNREYGDADLKIMGRAMQESYNLPTESDGIEAAIQFYLLGKIARAISSNMRGERASDDTVMDTAIYSMMLALVRSETFTVGLASPDEPESEEDDWAGQQMMYTMKGTQ